MANNTLNKTEFEIRTAFPEGLEAAFEFVTNPMNFPEIHPLIVNVVRRDERHYICFESIRLLFVPYCFNYWITVRKNIKDQSVTMKSEARRGVRAKLVYTKIQTDNESYLSEKIEIYGPWIARMFLSRKMKKAHRQMFENLKNIVPEASAQIPFQIRFKSLNF